MTTARPGRAIRRWVRGAALVVLVLCRAADANADAKTDVVILVNGDRITCEIVRLDRGRLEVKTDDAGTIDIEWDKIASVEAVRQFDVATSSGQRFLGSLKRTVNRSVLVAGGDFEISLKMLDVIEIAPVGASFWTKLDGSIDAGFNYTRSSGIAQTTFNTNTEYRRQAFRVKLTGSATVTSRSDGTGQDDRASGELSYLKYQGRRLLLGGAGRFESNESLGLVLRSQLGGVVGLRLVNSNRAQFLIAAGLAGNNEKPVDEPEVQNFESLFALETSFFMYDRPKTIFDTKVQYYPSLSDWGRQRLQLDSSIKRELWKDLNVGCDLFDTFDSRPPNPSAARNDFGIVISVGWTY